MKVLTAAQMREVDRRTIELGIPGIVLMENAGHRVVELLAEKFSPLSGHRIVVFCGKGNNGGDGFVVARQLFTRWKPAALHVVLTASPEELKGDAAENYRMLRACGCPVSADLAPEMHSATLVIDALLGTGIKGSVSGAYLELIRAINSGFPAAKVVAVDIPSGLASDSGECEGEAVKADYTVTFTALKVSQALPPACDRMGEVIVRQIGTPPDLYEPDDSIFLSQIHPAQFRHLLRARVPGGHKGTYGHVMVIGGSRGKSGAAAMTGMSAVRAGAGLVTVASASSAIDVIAAHAPELMTEPLAETASGGISIQSYDDGRLSELVRNKDVIAIGPGLGGDSETVELVQQVFAHCPHPTVVDADGLNALVGRDLQAKGRLRILTPHPGEMSRLTGLATAAIFKDRVDIARVFAHEHGVILVLKGQRTLLAFPDGRVWVNPTGTPALATGGTGDILTGIAAGFLAQFPDEPENAIAAAVYLHGLAGQIGERTLGDKSLAATDLLEYLPEAMRECTRLPD